MKSISIFLTGLLSVSIAYSHPGSQARTETDHQLMLDLLKIETLRPGTNGMDPEHYFDKLK